MNQVGSFQQYIFGLVDPLHPDQIRYVGRTNDMELTKRLHAIGSSLGVTMKDVWIMYMRYAGRNASIVTIEKSSFADSKAGELWAKEREKHWVQHHVAGGADLVNGPEWARHSSRVDVPKGIKTAWREAHALLWDFDRKATDELSFLSYLQVTSDAIKQLSQSPQIDSSKETTLDTSAIKTRLQNRRTKLITIVQSLLSAQPTLAVGDIQDLSNSRLFSSE